MSYTTVWPLNSYFASYTDPKKSLPHRGLSGVLENPKGLPYWIPEQRYLADYEDYLSVIEKIDKDEFVIVDPFLDRPIIKYWVEKGKSGVYDGIPGNGMIDFQYTEDLMSYRKREDGLLGIESISHLDTRLSRSEYLKSPTKYPLGISKTTPDQANFSNLDKIKEEYDDKIREEEERKAKEEEERRKKSEKISKIR